MNPETISNDDKRLKDTARLDGVYVVCGSQDLVFSLLVSAESSARAVRGLSDGVSARVPVPVAIERR